MNTRDAGCGRGVEDVHAQIQFLVGHFRAETGVRDETGWITKKEGGTFRSKQPQIIMLR